MAYIGMAHIGMAYIGMAYIVMVYIGMAYIGMAYIGMAYIGMAYVGMAYIGMAVGYDRVGDHHALGAVLVRQPERLMEAALVLFRCLGAFFFQRPGACRRRAPRTRGPIWRYLKTRLTEAFLTPPSDSI